MGTACRERITCRLIAETKTQSLSLGLTPCHRPPRKELRGISHHSHIKHPSPRFHCCPQDQLHQSLTRSGSWHLLGYVAVPQAIYLMLTSVLPSIRYTDGNVCVWGGGGGDLERQAQLPVQLSLLYAVNMSLCLHLTTSLVILTVPEDLVWEYEPKQTITEDKSSSTILAHYF